MIGYEVQGRRTVRGVDGKPRDEVRLANATTSSQAYQLAEAMVADDLKAWVFKTDNSGTSKTYKLLGVLPEDS